MLIDLGREIYYVRNKIRWQWYLCDEIYVSNMCLPQTFLQFMQDASDVMQLLLKTQTDFSDMEDDDPQVKQRAWSPPSWLIAQG